MHKHGFSSKTSACHVSFILLTLKSRSEVWSKLAKRARIKHIAPKCARNFDCACQRAKAFSHCVTLTCILLSQIISYSDTKVPIHVVMECKRVSMLYVGELIFLLHTSRSTECRGAPV